MKFSKSWAAVAALLALAGTAQASPMTLVDGGLGVLDSDTKLEWTANMNLPGGTMTWAAANAWIATLNTNNYAGHSDWRLPTLNPLDTSCFTPPEEYPYRNNCTGGELSNLFVTNLGYNNNGSGLISSLTSSDDTAEQIANLELFSNVQSFAYWSGTEYAPGTDLAWLFDTRYGGQGFGNKGTALYAVAVRDGNVAEVPEPQTLALVLLALGATVVARRRRPD